MPNPNDFSSNASTRAVWRKHETIEQATKRRNTLVRQLERGDPWAQQLAVDLAACTGPDRCGSPICPMCVRELRYWFISEAINCIKDLRSSNPSGLRDKVVRISAVPPEEYCFGGLAALDVRRLNKTLKKRFERAKFPLVFAGVDISLNLFNNSIARAYWQPHLYGLVVGLSPGQVEASLSAYYPPRESAKRPLYVCHCNKLADVLSYCIKPYFSRHSGHRNPDNGRKHSEPERLKGYQIQELALWLDQYKCEDRYLLHGCRKRGRHIVINEAVTTKLLGLR